MTLPPSQIEALAARLDEAERNRSQIGHFSLAWAYGRAEASRLGVLEYTSFVWGVLIGLVVFAEVPSAATVLGAGFISPGALLVARRTEKPDVELGQ